MSIGHSLIALGAAASAVAAGAQPVKDEQAVKAGQAAAAPVVLASANEVRRPGQAAANRPGEPVRRPAPRVTTCRCGDSQMVEDPAAEEQPDR